MAQAALDIPLVPLTHAPAGAPTRRACQAARLFGLTLDEPAGDDGAAAGGDLRRGEAFARHRAPVLRLEPSRVALLTGPSGSGKSTILRRAVAAARTQVWPAWRVIEPDRLRFRPGACVDQVGVSVHEAATLLARAGLGEARRLVAPPARLSDGERWRLRLALALQAAKRGARAGQVALLALDEFAATLDRACARAVARLLRSEVDRAAGVAAIVATSHEDIAAALAPDVVVRASLLAPPALERTSRPRRQPLRLRIEPGSLADYDALAPLHYRAGRPATWTCVLRALARPRPASPLERAGALVVSMPTRNGRWRELAWPGRYSTRGARSQRAVLRRLNAELRCISRVVVDPRFRGAGAATALVGAYLHNPQTIHTESVAAMGRFTAFFERAGMTAYPLTPAPADLRLLDALAQADVAAWRLAQPGSAWERARAGASEAFLARELRLWARSRLRQDKARALAADRLFRLACRSLAAEPLAYAHAVDAAGKG